jgi:hypothetical protein
MRRDSRALALRARIDARLATRRAANLSTGQAQLLERASNGPITRTDEPNYGTWRSLVQRGFLDRTGDHYETNDQGRAALAWALRAGAGARK